MRKIIFLILIIFLIYTRLVGLNWGLPYPMHPDERNMAWALLKLSPHNFFEPNFFAYGQFSLYLGYILLSLRKGLAVNFTNAVLSLRIVAVFASLITFFYLKKILDLFKLTNPLFLLIFIFSPALIQLAHFGTTESLLMAYVSALSYYSIKILKTKLTNKTRENYVGLMSFIIGLAIATKVSSLIFLIIPLLFFLFLPTKKRISQWIYQLVLIILGSLIISVIFSPYNFIDFNKFIDSMRYESAVATGTTAVFYIRQFIYSLPVLFQFTRVFPFALGEGDLVLFIVGFFTRLKDRRINFLRFTWLIIFLSNAFLFSKWSRFMAPVFPLMLIFTIFGLDYVWRVTKSHLIFLTFLLIAILPGIAYLSIYQSPDVRFKASNWIYKHIPAGSRILFETANVVDVPFPTNQGKSHWPNYRGVSFNFYNLDTDRKVSRDLHSQLEKADYIIIPSRRVFYDHTCYQSDREGRIKLFNHKWGYDLDVCNKYKKRYPKLNNYYEKLFSGKLGFEKIAEFASFPRLNFFGHSLQFADEGAEETWTVFDHPVIRVYKKVSKF